MYISNVGRRGSVAVGLGGRGRPVGRPTLTVWESAGGALLDHVLYHLLDLLEARLEAVLQEEHVLA